MKYQECIYKYYITEVKQQKQKNELITNYLNIFAIGYTVKTFPYHFLII